MTPRLLVAAVAGFVLFFLPALFVVSWTSAAQGRLEELETDGPSPAAQAAVAREANEAYCTPELKQILRRVLLSCGLLGGGGGRGCQPLEARNVATMDDADFNALFVPMKERGAIVQYDQSSAEIDPADETLVDRVFADRRGASYFLVVSRASPEGSVETNRELSRGRAEAVMTHLEETFGDDPELARRVGLLWLGEEYAQLDPTFCDWTRSGHTECTPDDLNRSAFVAWIDCRL